MSKQKKSFTLSKYSLHLFQVLPPVPSSKQIRQFCLKVIFTRARPRLSGIIAREAPSHHNISRRIQVRPARRGLCPRTLRRSSVIRVPQSRETRPEQGHQSSLHWTDERGIRTPGPHRAHRCQLGWTLPSPCYDDRELLCLLLLRTALWHNGHNIRPL